jgi:hypothetical protein
MPIFGEDVLHPSSGSKPKSGKHQFARSVTAFILRSKNKPTKKMPADMLPSDCLSSHRSKQALFIVTVLTTSKLLLLK